MKNQLLISVLISLILTSYSCIAHSQKATQVIVNMLLLGDEDTRINKRIAMQWAQPSRRENESSLSTADIDHYQIRYRKFGTQRYRFVVAYPPSLTTNLTLGGDVGDQYELSIRVVDTSGLASDYTDSELVAFDTPEPK